MDAVEFLKEKKRMCKSYIDTCYGCPFDCGCKKFNYNCGEFVSKHAEEAVSLVEQWSNEHPVITNLMKFEEVFGKTCVENGELVLVRPSWWFEEYREPRGE